MAPQKGYYAPADGQFDLQPLRNKLAEWPGKVWIWPVLYLPLLILAGLKAV